MDLQLFLEDLPATRRFRSRPLTVRADEVVEFAQRFDPQAIHLDSDAAALSSFPSIIASGWHTAAMTMRLVVEAMPLQTGSIGLGIERLRWRHPVYPGDVLIVCIEVVDARVSRSDARYGVVQTRVETQNQHGARVLEWHSVIRVPRRHATPSGDPIS